LSEGIINPKPDRPITDKRMMVRSAVFASASTINRLEAPKTNRPPRTGPREECWAIRPAIGKTSSKIMPDGIRKRPALVAVKCCTVRTKSGRT
jgi:hypothetical protein